MKDTMTKAKELYAFMGVPFTKQIQDRVVSQHKVDNKAPEVGNGYFGVRRDSNFSYDNWKRTERPEVCRQL